MVRQGRVAQELTLMKPLRSKAVEQNALSSSLRMAPRRS